MLKESIFIVRELNKEPFVKNFSFPVFECLSPLALMEILNEVLTEIQPKHPENIQDKTAKESVQAIITLLSILEYEPIKDCCDLEAIREGLENKEKVVIYPILSWLLQSILALKRKAYLAQFTLEVDVPVYLQQDETIYIYMNKQKDLIQTFQHRFFVYEDMQPSCVSKNNTLANNKMMQNNKSSLLKQTEKLRKDLELSVKSPEELLKAARQLRVEMEREKELARQTQEQAQQLSQAQQRLSELKRQSRGQSGADVDPAAIMTDLQKDIKANTAKVREKLPAELEDMKRKVSVLQKLAKIPAVTPSQLLEMKKEIKDVTSQIHKRNVKMAISYSCEEDKLNSAREKASIMNQNKNSKAGELQDLKKRLESAERESKVSAQQEDAPDGGQSLREKLKAKKSILRKECQEVAQLKAKHAELRRMERSLKQREQYFQLLVQILEVEKGKPGPSDAQKLLERMLAAQKNEHSQTDKTEIGKLKSMMESLRANVSAMMEENSSVRCQCHELLDQFERKRTYRAKALKEKAASLRDNTAELEKQVEEKKALLEVIRTKIKAATGELQAYQPPPQRSMHQERKSKSQAKPSRQTKSNKVQLDPGPLSWLNWHFQQ